MFLPGVKNILASWTQILRPKHMFPSIATPGNITRNIVSATIFPSLARPLEDNSSMPSLINITAPLELKYLQVSHCNCACWFNFLGDDGNLTAQLFVLRWLSIGLSYGHVCKNSHKSRRTWLNVFLVNKNLVVWDPVQILFASS